MKNKRYCTLKEVMDAVPIESLETAVWEEMALNIEVEGLYQDILEEVYGLTFPESSKSVLITPKVNKLMQLILHRYKDIYVHVTNKDTLTLEDCMEVLGKFNAIIMKTYDHYNRLIDLVEGDNALDLLANAETVSESRFNDTPQAGTSITDDNHLTTYTRNNTNQGYDNVAKVKEIEDLIGDYYSQWMNEFRGMWIYD